MARTLDLERRADLATRAFEVIRARGVHRTTMSDLAAALGLKRPTLYFYFRDLGAVFEAVHEATQRAYLTHVTARLAGVAHPIDLLIAVLRSTSEFHRAERERIVALFQLWAVGGADADQVLARNREFTDPFRAQLIRAVARGLETGAVAPCDPERIVDLTLAVLDGGLVQHITRTAPTTAIIDEYVLRVLAPLRRPRAARPATRPRTRPRTPRSRP
ncbi:MAG: TetR/AcrR family transcriptional regulator [Deltaproteobacteria bacterium]|nr:TetR/AcrR family transcriptional regulator [Deltaproteobacteria bacterium]